MKTQQYLHFYPGQPCQWNDTRSGESGIGRLVEVGKTHAAVETISTVHECMSWECKLILRHPATITKVEWNRFYSVVSPERSVSYTVIDPSKVLYLLSIGIDLFGLIAAGEALDRETISAEDLSNLPDSDFDFLHGPDELGMAYDPASKAIFRLDTQVPDSMAFETHEALRKIEIAVGGDIDNFVRDRLGYHTKAALYKALSAEQIDAVAMAIYNIEGKCQGMIIGDQTGIGKGRVAASIIRYGVLQGVQPVFLTEKANLFSDIYRDLAAIGSGNLVPFIVNGRESKTDIKDEDGDVIHQAPAPPIQKAIFESRELPRTYDFVLATYSQFNSSDKKPEKPNFLRAIAEDNIFILDEAHNSSGSSNTGEYLQGVIGSSKGAIFLSATFAKRPDNMPIYALKTAIRDCAMGKEDLVNAITNGGVALQEILSSQLVAEGQMLRRERSYEGIEVNYLTLDSLAVEHRAIADNITCILQDIILFQKTYILPLVKEMDKAIAAQGKESDLRKGTSDAGIDCTPYFSKVFNVINQMLFAIKAEAVADRAIMRLKEGKKPVIAFASTMGAFLETMDNEHGLPVSDGDLINADFGEVLRRGLDGIMRYTEKDVDGTSILKRFSVGGLDMEGQTEYHRIAEKIQKASTGICISPIDIVVRKIKDAGYSVAEVTGRKYELQLNVQHGYRDDPDSSLNGLGIISHEHQTGLVGMLKSRKRINTNDAFRQFNNNEVDVLMINQSGSTGASAHAIPTAKVPASEVKQRVMIVLQAELDINTEVQKRGRINRTGMIYKPIYDYVSSAIPAENRLMMMLQKKLKSLDANTTSNQKNSSAILDVPDFLNKYGDKVVKEYLMENPSINMLLDDPLKLAKNSDSDGNSGDKDAVEDAAHKVSGRVAVLSTKQQQDFYTEIAGRYSDYVEYQKQTGDYDLEVEAMNLEAETINEKIVKMGNGADTAFGQDSVLETVRANALKKPFSRVELDNLLSDALKEEDPRDQQRNLSRAYTNWLDEKWQQEERELEEKYAALLQNVPEQKKIRKMEAGHEKEEAIREAEKLVRESREAAFSAARRQSDNKRSFLLQLFDFFYVSKAVNYPVLTYGNGRESIPSVFLGFQIDLRKKNPFAPSSVILRFAISNGTKYMAIPASYHQDLYAIMGASSRAESFESREALLQHWETVTKNNTVDRKTRYIITGNLLQAFSDFKGKLISYTTIDQQVKKGILMPEYWVMEAGDEKVVVPLIKALPLIKSQSNRDVTTDSGIRFIRHGQGYRIIVAASRQKAGGIFLDKDLLPLVQDEVFQKVSDKMSTYIDGARLDEFVQILQRKHNPTVTIDRYQLKNLDHSQAVTFKTTYPIVPPAPAPLERGIEELDLERVELEALALLFELELLSI